jgi:hypothetical protein
MRFILLLLICLVSGCNTRIGCPGIHYGFGASIGAFVVCGLIFAGFVAIATAHNLQEGQRGEVIGGIVVWIVGGLLLQALPVSGGVQFVPLPCWCYASWIPWILSSVCWLCILFGCLCGLSGDKEGVEQGAAFLLLALGLNALLSFATPIGAVANNPPDPIAQWERLRDERSATLNRLMSDKEMLTSRIRNLGAKNKKELMANAIGKTLVEELEQLCQQIDTMAKEIEVVDTSAELANSHRRIVERQDLVKSGKLTDKDYERISTANHAVDKEQTPGSEIHRDKLLNELFLKEK